MELTVFSKNNREAKLPGLLCTNQRSFLLHPKDRIQVSFSDSQYLALHPICVNDGGVQPNR